MSTRERIMSVDFLRGLTVAAMILVNNPGSWSYVPHWMEHAAWHGFTFADTIFPTFLFIVGISITYALSSAHKEGVNKNEFTRRILKRSLILFGIGVLLNVFPFIDLSLYFTKHEIAPTDLTHFRIPGVLQRISIVFFFCALLYIHTKRNTQLLVAAALLLGYWLIMTLIPVPGVGPANLEKETNLAAWLDRTLLPGHLWMWAETWDPEGLLSTLPAIATGILGLLTGNILKEVTRSPLRKLLVMAIAGTILIVLGLGWDLIFPINKSIWTSSYVLFAGGISMLVLCFSYWLIDILGHQLLAKPFIVFGTNAMAAYILSEVLARLIDLITINGVSVKEFMYTHWFLTLWNDPFRASFVMGLAWVTLMFLPIYILYRKKIFIKV